MTAAPSLGIKPLAVHYLRVSTKDQADCHLPLLWDRLDCHEDGTTLARY
ncbi:hypothetical protein HGA01_22290 [Gordonia amicalis]|nr:hypothetical protein [Gordonia amicalis]NKX80195.1 hypothetical protein [Gordonia amicalis]